MLYQIAPITRGASFDSDLEEGFCKWKNLRYKLSTRMCAMIKTIHWIKRKLWYLDMYDGTTTLNSLLDNIEDEIMKEQRIPTMTLSCMLCQHDGQLT